MSSSSHPLSSPSSPWQVLLESLPNNLTIKVTPRARRIEYVGQMTDGALKIRLKAVPEDGEANRELLAFLDEETGSIWEIVAGWASTRKEVKRINGLI